MKTQTSFQQEKRFKEVLHLLKLDNLFVHQTAGGHYTISASHPTDDVQYVLSSYRDRNTAREFVDLGRCVQFALSLGVTSIHFRDAQDAPLKFV